LFGVYILLYSFKILLQRYKCLHYVYTYVCETFIKRLFNFDKVKFPSFSNAYIHKSELKNEENFELNMRYLMS